MRWGSASRVAGGISLAFGYLTAAGAIDIQRSTVTVNVPKPTINVPRPTISIPHPTVSVARPTVTVTPPKVTVAKPTVPVTVPKPTMTDAKVSVSRPAAISVAPTGAILKRAAPDAASTATAAKPVLPDSKAMPAKNEITDGQLPGSPKSNGSAPVQVLSNVPGAKAAATPTGPNGAPPATANAAPKNATVANTVRAAKTSANLTAKTVGTTSNLPPDEKMGDILKHWETRNGVTYLVETNVKTGQQTSYPYYTSTDKSSSSAKMASASAKTASTASGDCLPACSWTKDDPIWGYINGTASSSNYSINVPAGGSAGSGRPAFNASGASSMPTTPLGTIQGSILGAGLGPRRLTNEIVDAYGKDQLANGKVSDLPALREVPDDPPPPGPSLSAGPPGPLKPIEAETHNAANDLPDYNCPTCGLAETPAQAYDRATRPEDTTGLNLALLGVEVAFPEVAVAGMAIDTGILTGGLMYAYTGDKMALISGLAAAGLPSATSRYENSMATGFDAKGRGWGSLGDPSAVLPDALNKTPLTSPSSETLSLKPDTPPDLSGAPTAANNSFTKSAGPNASGATVPMSGNGTPYNLGNNPLPLSQGTGPNLTPQQNAPVPYYGQLPSGPGTR
jgi:hypothetical protein